MQSLWLRPTILRWIPYENPGTKGKHWQPHWSKITETTKGDELAIEETGKPYLKGSFS
jgi:hypothetical protein